MSLNRDETLKNAKPYSLEVTDERLKNKDWKNSWNALPYLACYHGKMSRKKAEEILQNFNVGTYLLRDSSLEDYHVISYVKKVIGNKKNISHLLIFIDRMTLHYNEPLSKSNPSKASNADAIVDNIVEFLKKNSSLYQTSVMNEFYKFFSGIEKHSLELDDKRLFNDKAELYPTLIYDDIILTYLACYHENMTKKEVEKILEGHDIGTYLVTRSPFSGHHTISAVTALGISHETIFLKRKCFQSSSSDFAAVKYDQATAVENIINYLKNHPNYTVNLRSAERKQAAEKKDSMQIPDDASNLIVNFSSRYQSLQKDQIQTKTMEDRQEEKKQPWL